MFGLVPFLSRRLGSSFLSWQMAQPDFALNANSLKHFGISSNDTFSCVTVVTISPSLGARLNPLSWSNVPKYTRWTRPEPDAGRHVRTDRQADANPRVLRMFSMLSYHFLFYALPFPWHFGRVSFDCKREERGESKRQEKEEAHSFAMYAIDRQTKRIIIAIRHVIWIGQSTLNSLSLSLSLSTRTFNSIHFFHI